jgi:hypothetical protein
VTSIQQMSEQMQTLFEQDAVELGKQAGMRERTMSFSQLAMLLILGWLSHASAGQSRLARFAGKVGVRVSKQAVDCHFTMRTANWLLALLRRTIQRCVTSEHAVSIPLLSQFAAVLVEDASMITLPNACRDVWKGKGQSEKSSQASIKLTVRLDLCKGGLDGPHLQDGKQHELNSVLREHNMPKGSLWIADLGYWNLIYVASLVRSGVYFLMRYKVNLTLWSEGEHKQRLDLLSCLPKQTGEQAELRVSVGAKSQLRNVRLLAERVPQEAYDRRVVQIRERYRKKCTPIPQYVLDLAWWTIVLTNVPNTMVSANQAFALLRARWQIELLFKLWKSYGKIDEWQSEKPALILCQVYAKLLAMLLQHWFLLLSCWDDPHHSWIGVADAFRDQTPVLIHGLRGHLALDHALSLICEAIQGGCSIPAHSKRLSTSRRLLLDEVIALT